MTSRLRAVLITGLLVIIGLGIALFIPTVRDKAEQFLLLLTVGIAVATLYFAWDSACASRESLRISEEAAAERPALSMELTDDQGTHVLRMAADRKEQTSLMRASFGLLGQASHDCMVLCTIWNNGRKVANHVHVWLNYDPERVQPVKDSFLFPQGKRSIIIPDDNSGELQLHCESVSPSSGSEFRIALRILTPGRCLFEYKVTCDEGVMPWGGQWFEVPAA